MTARILAALLLLASGVGVRAQLLSICPNVDEVKIGGQCVQISTIIDTSNVTMWNPSCPEGYEMVMRSNMRHGCAKDVIDAK